MYSCIQCLLSVLGSGHGRVMNMIYIFIGNLCTIYFCILHNIMYNILVHSQVLYTYSIWITPCPPKFSCLKCQWECLALLLIGVSVNQLHTAGSTSLDIPLVTAAYVSTLMYVSKRLWASPLCTGSSAFISIYVLIQVFLWVCISLVKCFFGDTCDIHHQARKIKKSLQLVES